MNRTALCLKMLAILKSRRQPINTKELAQALETNPRNIREYRRELELAGYRIKETRGRYGGYSLEHDYGIAIPPLEENEVRALEEAGSFLVGQPTYLRKEELQSVLEKVRLSNTTPTPTSVVYKQVGLSGIEDNKILEYLEKTIQAIDTRHVILIRYQGKNDLQPKERFVDPYEVVNRENYCYLIGFDHERMDYRTYKFSNQRLFNVEVLNSTYTRIPSFDLDRVVGQTKIFAGAIVRYHVILPLTQERIFKEMYWGNNLLRGKEADGFVQYSFLNDSFSYVKELLFKMGSEIRLTGPQERVEEYKKTLQEVLNQYGEE